ncbi:MAG: amino acid ABC transporter substrate-binding protein, partial [Desulfobacterales bacterium]|nr:amino acid ABC transporter substrate-binding protein [Desulfobacterales bacterium]
SETDTGGVKGFFYDMMIEALEKRMGVSTVWAALPWKRCQENVRMGRFDAMITVPTEERAAYSDTHPDPFYLKQIKLFTHVGHERLDEINAIRTIEDIKKGGYTVITYSGNGWHKKNVTSIGVPTFETARVRNVWLMLAAKRGDLVIEWPMGAYPDINELGVGDRVLETDVSLEAMQFHLLISKKSNYKKILPRFNDVIKAMHADGTMKKILSAYE